MPATTDRTQRDSAAPTQAAGLAEPARFLRKHWVKLLGTTAVVLAPCYWHREIVASDLGSHLYNAWLVQLIRNGQAPGLWVAPQHTNVLFDLLLTGFGSIFGLRVAEKIAVSLAVLIFFWGMFALISAATRRAPWLLLPILAMVTYGWTFHMGFFNYYLALGLSFFSLAIFWRGERWERLIAFAIAPLVLVAHPLGFLWLLAAGAYIGIANRAPQRRHPWVLFAAAVASLFVVHFYLWHHYVADPGAKPFYAFSGADQLVLFGERYRLLARAVLVYALVFLAVDCVRRRSSSELWKSYALPLQLYILVWMAVGLLPDAIHFAPPTATIALLTERLTSVSAVLGCCLLGAMRPSKWHLAVAAALAAVFFSFLYQDTGVVNRMETQIEQLVGKLPPDQRVMATIMPPPGSRILVQHIIDRACISRCFSYGNYEPGSRVFRVRARPGNRYVLSDYDLATDTEEGDYTVEPEDLPAYQVYQCSEEGTEFCIRALQAGEKNDRLGIHPDN
jgi:hypothetical protein